LSQILGFEERLRQAFSNASISEIAVKLDLSYHGARNYFGGRIPSAEKLKQISELTGCSIHWLLTGHGPKTTGGYPAEEVLLFLENHIQEALNQLAAGEKKHPSEIIALLATEALIARGLVNEQLPTAQFRFYRNDSYASVPIPLLGELEAGKPIVEFTAPQQVKSWSCFLTGPIPRLPSGSSMTPWPMRRSSKVTSSSVRPRHRQKPASQWSSLLIRTTQC
jgi:hypothetical protein